MKQNPILFILVSLLFLSAIPAARADDPAAASDSTESRLRDALRNAMLQLRDDKKEIATLQAAQDDSNKANADLKGKVDGLNDEVTKLTQQLAENKAAADKALADAQAQIADQAGQLGRLNDALKQWKDAYAQAVLVANEKEAERVKFAAQTADLQRLADKRELENLELYKIGSEILTRYKEFGLGEALGAKEPFVGLTRVKLENLVQDYRNKLLDHALTTTPQAKPAAVAAAPAPPSPATSVP